VRGIGLPIPAGRAVLGGCSLTPLELASPPRYDPRSPARSVNEPTDATPESFLSSPTDEETSGPLPCFIKLGHFAARAEEH
jgi:hypothetical protein